MRVVVAEDSVLFREGLVRLLTEADHIVVAAVGDATSLVEAVHTHHPDAVVADVRMPPTMSDDGARAALALRRALPQVPILLLSQHVETRHAVELVSTAAFGYLLKDRVLHVDDFLDALQRVAAGGSALDPSIVAALVRPPTTGRRLMSLTAREHEVLALVAEGRSNTTIARRLFVSDRTIETHMRSIFTKLALQDAGEGHRRVLAVLAFLTDQG